jgi:DNA modification methylase
MDNIKLFNNDCLEEMKNIEDKSVDLIFTDLPYCGITNSKKDSEIACKWNTPIDLDLMWKEFKRIRKDTTPIVFTCSTKFGYSLIESNKKEFRYDMVWIKGDTGYCCEKCNFEKKPKISKVGFLNSKRLPLKSHEMVYVFYKKCPSKTYGNNIKKYHKHKYLDIERNTKDNNHIKEGQIYNNGKAMNVISDGKGNQYDPPLPNSIIKEDKGQKGEVYGKLKKNGACERLYTPPLPNTIIKEYDNKKDSSYRLNKVHAIYSVNTPYYDPPLPNSILEIASQKKKHSTQKPTGLSDFFIKYYSNEGDIVLDNCMGSGSTGISCINLNRKFIGIERDEEIFKVAKERLNI